MYQGEVVFFLGEGGGGHQYLLLLGFLSSPEGGIDRNWNNFKYEYYRRTPFLKKKQNTHT